MSDRRILVIDDNPQNLLLLVRFLEAKGFAVDSATCTAEADQAMARGAPNLALVDISLPGEDGLSWVRRTRPLAPATRFLAVTAYTSADVHEEALAAGCDGFVTKPVALKSLLELVQGQLHPSDSPPTLH